MFAPPRILGYQGRDVWCGSCGQLKSRSGLSWGPTLPRDAALFPVREDRRAPVQTHAPPQCLCAARHCITELLLRFFCTCGRQASREMLIIREQEVDRPSSLSVSRAQPNLFALWSCYFFLRFLVFKPSDTNYCINFLCSSKKKQKNISLAPSCRRLINKKGTN